MSLFTQLPYALTLLIVLAIWATPDVLDSIRKHPKGDTVVVRDGGSHNLFRLGLSAAIIAAALLAHFQPQGTLPYHRPYLFVLGILLAFAGFALRRWAIRTLGRFFTVDVATFADQRVVDAPPYRRIRHPAYSGSILSLLGTTLMLGHGLGLAAGGPGHRRHLRLPRPPGRARPAGSAGRTLRRLYAPDEAVYSLSMVSSVGAQRSGGAGGQGR
jgi:hypothetical protein